MKRIAPVYYMHKDIAMKDIYRKTLTTILNVLLFSTSTFLHAGNPVWTLTPLTATTLSVPSNDVATVQYQVTNESTKTHTLLMQSIKGITQLTTGLGICGNPFILTAKASCTLSLEVNGSQLTKPITDGPLVCEQGSLLQCYRPASANLLHITKAAAITDATITVTGSPLTLITDGSTGTLTINNTSLLVAATNITSNFTGTALDGNVIETGNTCANVAPQSSCTLTYTPGSTVVAQTDFTIQGSNTNALTAAIQIDAASTISTISPSSGPAAGGVGVTLTGSGFTGATGITFGGIAATSVYVVDSTTLTAVTPAHATGAVDVVVTTPNGTGTKTNGYTYLTTAVGQSAYGGTIACLNGGLNNLIAATTDNNTAIQWGGNGVETFAISNTDGATNTATIVNCLTTTAGGGCPGNIAVNTYAAGICSTYAVDSQGNSPCQFGFTCYMDWYLPAPDQLNCLYQNHTAIGGFNTTSGDASRYWTSEETGAFYAYNVFFDTGTPGAAGKGPAAGNPSIVRCVRSFTP